MTDEIEVSLFGMLSDIPKILKTNRKLEDVEELTLNIHKIKNKLESFIESFFLQFFFYGYELDIEGINEEALSAIEDHFSNFRKKELPTNMIDSFKEAVEILQDMDTSVYSDPPKDEDLYEAYLNFLPRLFASFKQDKTVLKDRIGNYGSIEILIDRTLAQIGKLKGQKKL